MSRARGKQNKQQTYNVYLWRVLVMLIPPRLPWQPQTISLEERVFMAI